MAVMSSPEFKTNRSTKPQLNRVGLIVKAAPRKLKKLPVLGSTEKSNTYDAAFAELVETPKASVAAAKSPKTSTFFTINSPFSQISAAQQRLHGRARRNN